jgi:hypothetical protein
LSLVQIRSPSIAAANRHGVTVTTFDSTLHRSSPTPLPTSTKHPYAVPAAKPEKLALVGSPTATRADTSPDTVAEHGCAHGVVAGAHTTV